MPAYKDKSHEELRWEDYRLGDKGMVILKINSFQSMSSLFSTLNSSNLFGPKTPLVVQGLEPRLQHSTIQVLVFLIQPTLLIQIHHPDFIHNA